MNLSKCFLANRDNFSPYEQTLRRILQRTVIRATIKIFNSFYYFHRVNAKPGIITSFLEDCMHSSQEVMSINFIIIKYS